jgi:hypothetical protein
MFPSLKVEFIPAYAAVFFQEIGNFGRGETPDLIEPMRPSFRCVARASESPVGYNSISVVESR